MSSIAAPVRRPKTTTQSIINVTPDDVKVTPFPHAVRDEFLDETLYKRLREEFPSDDVFDRNTSLGGRAGRDLYRGDAPYAELLTQSKAWAELHEYINSERYVQFVLDTFADQWLEQGCKIDPEKAKYVDYIEERSVLAQNSRVRIQIEQTLDRLTGLKQRNDLFVRLDLAQGAVGYGKPVHCDRPNRLISMLVYFCDADEINLQGGDLVIHQHRESKPIDQYERHPQPSHVREVARLRAQHNRGIIFMGCNNSYHSATPVESQDGYRDFIYVSVTSRSKKIW